MFLLNLFVTSCISPSSTQVIFAKESQVNGSFFKSITLSESTTGMYQTIIFFFLSDNSIWYCFLYFVMTLIAAAYDAQMFFNCFNPYDNWVNDTFRLYYHQIQTHHYKWNSLSNGYKKNNKLFQQMTMLQYWVYLLILILIQSHHTIFNIAKLYPFFLLPYLNSFIDLELVYY